jgi:hypothetical protein
MTRFLAVGGAVAALVLSGCGGGPSDPSALTRLRGTAVDQNSTGGDDGGEGDAARTCAISGGRVGDGIDLEGHVASGDHSGFEMGVNGNRVKNGATVRVSTGGASFRCNGKPTTAECRASVKPSAQVHVRGGLNVCDMSNALVTASEVKVQKP